MLKRLRMWWRAWKLCDVLWMARTMACPFAYALKGPVVVHSKGTEVKWRKGSCDCRVVKPCWILVVNWEIGKGRQDLLARQVFNTGLVLAGLYIVDCSPGLSTLLRKRMSSQLL